MVGGIQWANTFASTQVRAELIALDCMGLNFPTGKTLATMQLEEPSLQIKLCSIRERIGLGAVNEQLSSPVPVESLCHYKKLVTLTCLLAIG